MTLLVHSLSNEKLTYEHLSYGSLGQVSIINAFKIKQNIYKIKPLNHKIRS